MKTNKKITINVIIIIIALLIGINITFFSNSMRFFLNRINAEEVNKYPITTDTTNEKYCKIGSYQELVDYSKSYEMYASEYYSINVRFAITSENQDVLSDFVSIGTEEYPFKANLYVANSSRINISLDKPLFNYIYDSCQILNVDDTTVISPVTLCSLTKPENDSYPLFANNVKHNLDNTIQPTWNITFGYQMVNYNDNTSTGDISGIIGTIEEDAKVKLIITNNAIKSDSEYSQLRGTKDIGLACGLMKSGSSLDVTINSGTNKSYNITSTEGNAGGIIGKMENNTELTVKNIISTEGTISAENGFAGGFVGYAESSSLIFNNPTDEKIFVNVNGTEGSGGVFGYYQNTKDNFTIENYNIHCTANGNNVGGIFGKLQNDGNIIINETNSITITGSGTNYGGLIGLYQASSSEKILKIIGWEEKKLEVNVSKNDTATNYGGLIGSAENSNAYIKCSDIIVNASGCNDYVTSFGGFIGKNGSGLLDVNNFTINITDNNDFKGGGIVGNMSSGVLRLSGKTDLSNTTCVEGSANYGQIVGIRGNQAFIYALDGWELIRSSTPVQADDIGTWGEVVRFSGKLNKNDVLNFDEINHIVTIKSASLTVNSFAEFVILALNNQMNNAEQPENSALQFEDISICTNAKIMSANINLNCDIDLSGTGITGLTRDDGKDATGGYTNDKYTGEFNGNNHVITLAIGEPYGFRIVDNAETLINDNQTHGDGKIYHHKYVGLLGKSLDSPMFKNLTINGTINVCSKTNEMFVSSLSPQHVRGNITFENINESVNINIFDVNTKCMCGGLIGEIYSNSNPTISINNCNISTVINQRSTKNETYMGGFIGRILSQNSVLTIDAKDITLSVNIEDNNNSISKVGGFIAYIEECSSIPSMRLKDLKLNQTTITSNNDSYGGALLGQIWNNINVIFDNVVATDCIVTQNGEGGFAGLVTIGSGYWQVNDIDINNITVNGSQASSFGMIVNHGFTTDNSKAMYLELTNNDSYVITDTTTEDFNLNSSIFFDELMVYANSSKGSAFNNNSAVVSIHTENEGIPTVIMDGKNCNTYQSQTKFANENNKKNNYVRYYYNLDYIREKENLSSGEKLLKWSLNYYANSNIKEYFKNPFGGKTIPKDTYNMEGLSYYPVSISDVTIEGSTFKFYNREFEESETGNGNTDNKARPAREYTQHNGMQCGILYSPSNLKANNLTFEGSIGTTANGRNSGVLASGTLSKSSIDGITFDGFYVYNFDSGLEAYSGLLALGISGTCKISNVKTTNAYLNINNFPKENIKDGTVIAASSLIGNSSGKNGDQVIFDKIILDGRKSSLEDTTANAELTKVYGTSKSIFTNAILMNALLYPKDQKSVSIYNFKYDEDWDENGNPIHAVTYGEELYTSVEYRDKQQKYMRSTHFVSPVDNNATAPYDFSINFLPYVKEKRFDKYSCHEVRVNVSYPNIVDGCGTYDDPYIISSSDQLILIDLILNKLDYFPDGTAITIRNDNYKAECNGTETTYVWSTDNNNFCLATKDISGDYIPSNTNDTILMSQICTILSTAYYKLDCNIEIPAISNYTGLGRTTDFMGVIDGNGYTITNNCPTPLIYSSKGSVVKNLNLEITGAITDYNGGKINGSFVATGTGKNKYGTCPFYGGVIGIVNGGDNIIDNVGITYNHAENITISIKDEDMPGNVAIGGYIGVVRYGGVIFRNMDKVDENKRSGIKGDVNPMFAEDIISNDEKVHLYCNPIIGRVIDGYAITESNSYEPREENVTMKNSTKNYSISNIDKNSDVKLSFSDITAFSANGGTKFLSTITVPDSQSMFLMGCITMSGAGKYNLTKNAYNNQLYGYGNGQMTRHGDYSNIGTKDSEDFKIISQYDKYLKSSGTETQSDILEVIPYIIYKYTTPTVNIIKDTGATYTGTICNYPARTLTSNESVFDIEFTSNYKYNLPDGFRGIGSLTDIDGSTVLTANQNEYSQMKIHNINGNNATINLNMSMYSYEYDNYTYDRNYFTGLGLFNTLLQNHNNFLPKNNAELGTIQDFTITGTIKADKFTNTGETSYITDLLQLGGLAGTTYGYSKCDINLENVNTDNLEIVSHSSNSVGGLIGYLRGSGTFTAKNCNANQLNITSYKHTGGIVGYAWGYDTNIDRITLSMNSLKSINVDGSFSDLNCVGGIIGGTFNQSHELKNINITQGNMTISGNSTMGGIIGSANDGEQTGNWEYNISDVNINQTDFLLESKTNNISNYSGGLIGIIKDTETGNVKFNITNCNIIGESATSQNKIEGTSLAGGLIGQDASKTTINNCRIEKYTMYCYKDDINSSGGFIGKVQANDTIIKNSSIQNCTIQFNGDSGSTYENCIGGIVGYCDSSISGYNIALNNVNLVTSNNNIANVGMIIGGVNSNASAKLVGVSVRKAIGTENLETFGIEKGNNSYVIYSDKNGACFDSPNTSISTINNSSNLLDYGVFPYATINPKTNIDDITFFTSDIADVLKTNSDFENYSNKISTFNTETGSKIENDFPVLIINDSNNTNVTNMINKYIHILTNDNSITNYAIDMPNIYNVDISVYRYDDSSNKFTTDQDYTKTLIKFSDNKFGMSNEDYDSNYNNQFTLIDIQYYSPTEIDKIAYHLYIPVMVEKMLKYDFTAEILSGTNYKVSDYVDKNAVMESYGVPVTMHIKYSYQRSVDEWQSAINMGENILKGYGKTILMKSRNSTIQLDSDTKLVLVDRNNYSKAYYSTMGEAFNKDDNNKLTFSKFKTANNEYFETVSLYDLIEKSANITVAEDINGNLVKCSETDINKATVKVKSINGYDYYMPKSENSVAEEKYYTITINPNTLIDASNILPVEEDYYLSVFTQNSNNEMINISVTGDIKLIDDNMTTPSHVRNNKDVSMILGNLYNQVFTFKANNSNGVINEDNNELSAEMKTTISIKQDSKEQIKDYLGNNAISIYHGFIIDLTKFYKNEDENLITDKGVKGSPYIKGTYKIGNTVYPIAYYCDESEITLMAYDDTNTMVDIKKQLQSGSVVISCDDLIISYDSIGIIEQFPERQKDSDNDIGTVLNSSSNIAYVPDNIVYSSVSEKINDSNRYYREGDITVAKLNYNISVNTDDADKFSNLGVNGNVAPETIEAIGYYDFSELPKEDVEKAKKVSVSLMLMQKQQDGTYSKNIDIEDYLENIIVNGNLQNISENQNILSLDFDMSDLEFQNMSFTIETEYTVKTGGKFEENNLQYSNYKVLMVAKLIDENGEVITNSQCDDYLIYTNAKIFTELLN